MIYIFLILLGLALGSFANATAWRLRMQEDVKMKIAGLKKSKSTTKVHSDLSSKLQGLSITTGRSMCTHCHHQLAWYDLIPLISWASLRGKCRYCQAKVSWQYPFTELALATILPISYYAWPMEISTWLGSLLFGIYTVLLIVLTVLFIYDLKSMELPTPVVYLAGVISAVFVAVSAVEIGDTSVLVSSVLGSLGLGGMFWAIYQVSKGAWIGGGDVRLGFAMGLFLGWQKALLALSLAAYVGTLVIIVALVRGKYHKKMKLPFGPLLIIGWIVAFLWGQPLIDWYLGLIGL